MVVYAIDLDGTLCETQRNNYQASRPIKKRIQRANELFDRGNVILIFTARGSSSGINWQQFTEKQLADWGVKYNQLILGKPHYDVIIDDKAMSIKDWMR